jgi:hypothetical protein
VSSPGLLAECDSNTQEAGVETNITAVQGAQDVDTATKQLASVQ